MTILFYTGLFLILMIGWYLVWKYSLSHIPIVREVCGLNLTNSTVKNAKINNTKKYNLVDNDNDDNNNDNNDNNKIIKQTIER